MTNPRLERPLFLVLVALHLLFFVFLVADRRMPRGQDVAYQQIGLSREVAGVALSGGPLPLALLPFRWHFDYYPSLPLFYAGLLVDELLLLVGSWVLARRYYADPRVVFFVAAAAGGSSLWAVQTGHNFHAVTALPLALALLHGFAETGRGSRLFLAANLLAIQAIGQPRAAPLTSLLAAIVYAAFCFLRGPRIPRPGLVWIAGSILSWGMAVWVLFTSRCNFSLDPAGPVWELPLRLSDLLLGLSPSRHYTLFCGLLTVAFAVLGAARAERRSLLLAGGGLLAFVLLLLLQSLILRPPPPHPLHSFHWTYPASPDAPSLLMPFLRLALVFASGRGLEIALRDRGTEKRLLPRAAAGMALLALVLIVLSVVVEVHWIDGLSRVVLPVSSPAPHLASATIRSGLLGTTALWAGLAAVALAGLASARTFALAAVLVLVFQPLDVFGWKFRMTWLNSNPRSALSAGATPARSSWIRGIDRDPPTAVTLRPDSLYLRGAGINAMAWVILGLGAVGRLALRPGKEAIP